MALEKAGLEVDAIDFGGWDKKITPGNPFFAKIGFPGPFPKKLLFGRHFSALRAIKMPADVVFP